MALIGAYFADDLNKAIEEVRKSTEVIHAHDEAITGAIAIAVAVVIAY